MVLGLGVLLLVAPGVGSSQEKQPSQAKHKCASIQSLDGQCADDKLVEKAEKRASVISSNQASYFGTPMGTVGLPFIPHERLFRDDRLLFGIPVEKTTP
jgi:hypothetical protein